MKKVINILLVIVLLASTAALGWITYGYRDWNVQNWRDTVKQIKATEVVAVDNQNLKFDVINSDNLCLSVGEATVTSDGKSRTITATVYPENTSNKNVDWSIAWENPNSDFANGKAVTDYVTIVPEQDGSTTATATCKASFAEETVVITVITRDGGFGATCNVIFSGKPTELNMFTASDDIGNIENNGIYQVLSTPANSSDGFRKYRFSITLDNEYGAVKTGYKKYRMNVVLNNEIIIGNLRKYPNGEKPDEWVSTKTAPQGYKENILGITQPVSYPTSQYSPWTGSYWDFCIKPDYLERYYACYDDYTSGPLYQKIGEFDTHLYVNHVKEIVNDDELSFTISIWPDGLEDVVKQFTLVLRPPVNGVEVNPGAVEF